MRGHNCGIFCRFSIDKESEEERGKKLALRRGAAKKMMKKEKEKEKEKEKKIDTDTDTDTDNDAEDE